jgi:pimeloyl-ACP methyl ester carboxylesterase
MRGYGTTDQPSAIESYTMLHLVGDVVGLIDALDAEGAVLVGHDWGAPVAWQTALLRPDLIRGVVGLSIPYLARAPVSPVAALRQALGDDFYVVYFQQSGLVEAELERDTRATLRRLLYSLSGDAPPGTAEAFTHVGDGALANTLDPDTLPSWLTETDLNVFVAEYERSGFRGGLNWYRTLDLTWELTAPWQGARVTSPALFMAGDRDLTLNFPGFQDVITGLPTLVPNLRQSVILPGCGHWTQQERPAEVNHAILDLLSTL